MHRLFAPIACCVLGPADLGDALVSGLCIRVEF